MKKLIFLWILSQISFVSLSQVKLDIWNKKTVSQNKVIGKILVKELPSIFESKCPDNTVEIYERIPTYSIKVSTSNRSTYQFKPTTYVSKSGRSIISYSEKNGWQGFYKSTSGESFSMIPNKIFTDKNVVSDSSKSVCGQVDIPINKKKKNNIPSVSATNWNNTQFYNRLDPIKKICTIYIESSFEVYQSLGSNEDACLNYIYNYFLGFENIYKKEGILFRLKKIHLNTQSDPYLNTDGPLTLVLFKNRIGNNIPVNPESHFKMLLDLNWFGGGIGTLGSYGQSNGYENLSPDLNSSNCHTLINLGQDLIGYPGPSVVPLPQNTTLAGYSSIINIASHELGHNLGARHTHWCGWKDDTGNPIGMIDSCGLAEYNLGTTCSDDPGYGKFSIQPSIMSYCPGYFRNISNELGNKPIRLPYWENISGSLYFNTGGLSTRGFDKYPRHSIRSTLYLSSDIGEEPTESLPTVSTYETTNSIGITTALSGGVVSDTGQSPFMIRGVVWSKTNTEPDIYNNDGYVIGEYGYTGSFNCAITNLIGNTTYYVRAFASNLSGVSYGQIRTFTTSPTQLPTLATSYQSKTNTSIKAGGSNINSGGGQIIEKGIIWSTSSTNIDYNLSTKIIDQSEEFNLPSDFSVIITDLSPSTTYFLKSFVKTDYGIGYGDLISVQTSSSNSITFSEIEIIDVLSIRARLSFSLTSDGGSPIITKGLCWSTSPSPTISDSKTESNISLIPQEQFIGTLNALSQSTTYYLRAFAQNSQGVTYSDQEVIFTTKKLFFYITDISTSSPPNSFTSTIYLDTDESPIRVGFALSQLTPPPPPFDVAIAAYADFYTDIPSGFPTGQFSGFREITISNVLCPTCPYAGLSSLVWVVPYIVDKFGLVVVGTVTTYDLSVIPRIKLNVPNLVTPTSIQFSGEVTSDGGSPIVERGIIYKIGESPSFNDPNTEKKLTTGQLGQFTMNVTNLTPNTNYRVRAFAKNQSGKIGTSFDISVKTPIQVPILSTSPVVSGLTGNSVVLSGQVLNRWGKDIISMGFNYSTDQTFTNTSIKSVTPTDLPYSSTITDILPNTTYFFRSYAITSDGTGYGEVRSFTSLAGTGPPTLITLQADNITTESATLGGNIISENGSPVIQMGIVWSQQPNPYYNMPVFEGFTTNYSPIQPPNQPWNITVAVNSGQTYYVRSFAINANGIGYGQQISFTALTVQNIPSLITSAISNLTSSSCISGGTIQSNGSSNIIQTGVCWSTSPFPTIDLPTKTTDGPNTSSFVSNVTNLSPNTTYYLRAYATNSIGTGYGNELQFTPLVLSQIPTITTSQSTTINSNSAASGGENINQGDGPVTQRGVIWSTSFDNIDINLSTKTQNGFGNSAFTSSITGLLPNTTYFIKAYAKNSYGVGYGEPVSITTPISGDKICTIFGMEASEGPTTLGLRWFGKFDLNVNCQSYKVEVSRYPSDPTNNPNLSPLQTYVINNANPYLPNINDISQGFVKLIMKPQPSSVDQTFGSWFSLNVKCNGTCITNPVTKYYFYISPP